MPVDSERKYRKSKMDLDGGCKGQYRHNAGVMMETSGIGKERQRSHDEEVTGKVAVKPSGARR